MTDYCGCCGRETSPRRIWCSRCDTHVLTAGSFEHRTYYAQFKKDCPWQVGTDIAAAEGDPRP